jgi:hypothetical protein
MTLGPPLWATGSWATDAWANGSWSTSAPLTPGVFGDLTTLFVAYEATLAAAHNGADDMSSLVMLAQPTVRGASASPDDLNTAYAEYLS